MKEYDLFVPLFYNDGRPVESEKFHQLQEVLRDHFGGLTVFPQPNKGFWRMAGVTYREEIVIYRVIATAQDDSRRFLQDLKEQLRVQFQQEEILIVERDIRTL